MFFVLTLIIEFLIRQILLNSNPAGSDNTIVDGIMIFALLVALFLDVHKNQKLHYAEMPILLGALFRITLVIFDIYGRSIYVLPNSGGDCDMFYRNAVNVMNDGTTIRGFFPQMMGMLFRIIGSSRLYAQFLLSVCSVISLCLLASLLSSVKIDLKVKYNIVMITALLPNLAILSSLFLRESLVAMLVTLSFYLFYQWYCKGKKLPLCFAFIMVLFASRFHSGCVALAVGYVAVILLYDRSTAQFKLETKNLIPALFILLIMSFVFINYSDKFLGKMSNVESIEDIAKTNDMGGSSYARYVGNSNNPLSMIIFTLPRMLYFLFSPFPWQWRGISDLIAFFFSSLFYMITTLKTYRFLKSGEKKNRSLVIALIIVAVASAFVFAWGTSNTGTAVRHRDKMIMIWALLLALTYPSNNALSINTNTKQKRGVHNES